MQEDSDELLNMLDKLALEKKVVLLMQKQIELNNYMEDLRNEIGEDALELFGKDGTVVRLEAEIAELNAGIEELEGRVGELSLKDILGEDMVEGSQVADYEGVVEYLEDMDAGDSIDEEMQKLDDILADLARKQAEAEKDLEG